jgi:hypothetical protein
MDSPRPIDDRRAFARNPAPESPASAWRSRSTALANPSHGAPLDAFCDAVFAELTAGVSLEIGYGPTVGIGERPASALREAFQRSADRAAVRTYSP